MKTSRIDAADTSCEPAAASGQRVASLRAAMTGRTEERGAVLQRAIDQSPRVLAQRQALQAAFGGAVQRQAAGLEDDEPSQARMDTGATRVGLKEDDGLPPLQTRIEGTDDASVAEAIGAPQVNATGMPQQLKAGIEALSGMELSAVRVHRNSDKPAQLNALAYAQGTDIHLGPGQEKHLPHEAWHVVQQAQGRVRPTMQMKDGIPVNADRALEAEADAMGARALHVEGGHAGATLSPHPKPLERNANGAALQARWMIRDGHNFDVDEHYVLKPGESWADDAQALPASQGIASSSLEGPSSGMEADHFPKQESKPEQVDDDAPTSNPTVASLVQSIESAESILHRAEDLVEKDPESIGSSSDRNSIALPDAEPVNRPPHSIHVSSSDSDEPPVAIAAAVDRSHSSSDSDRDRLPVVSPSVDSGESSPHVVRIWSDKSLDETPVARDSSRRSSFSSQRARQSIEPSHIEAARRSPDSERELAIGVREEHQPAQRGAGQVRRRRPLTAARFVSGVSAPLIDIGSLLLAAISTTLDATGKGPAFIVGVVLVVIAGLRAIAQDVAKHEDDPRTSGMRLLHTAGALTPSLMTIPMGIAGTVYGADTMNVGAAVWIPFVFGLLAIFIVHFIKLMKRFD